MCGGKGRDCVDATPTPPSALTVAGSDSGGGAGIQADLKSFSAFGVYGTSVITAITAQNTLGVSRAKTLDPCLVVDQMETVLDDIGANAAKTGMLANGEIVRAVAATFARYRLSQLVVDPVMIATSGDPLLDADAITSVREALLPLTLVVTPNVPEAERLTGRPIRTVAAMQEAARALIDAGCRFVVITGGHLDVREEDLTGVEHHGITIDTTTPTTPEGSSGVRTALPLQTAPPVPGRWAVDLIYDGERFTLLRAPFFDTKNTHGTGCTLSAAITAGLALGLSPVAATYVAKQYVTQCVRHAFDLGRGTGPTNHLVPFTPDLKKIPQLTETPMTFDKPNSAGGLHHAQRGPAVPGGSDHDALY